MKCIFLHIFRKYFFAIPCCVKCPYLVKCFPKLPPFRISANNNFPRFSSIEAIIFSSDSPNVSCSTYIIALQTSTIQDVSIHSKPFLQSSMIDRIIHRARKEMQLYRHTIQGSLQMLQSDIIFQFKLLLSILHNPLPTSMNPNINISRSTRKGFGYIKAFS